MRRLRDAVDVMLCRRTSARKKRLAEQQSVANFAKAGAEKNRENLDDQIKMLKDLFQRQQHLLAGDHDVEHSS